MTISLIPDSDVQIVPLRSQLPEGFVSRATDESTETMIIVRKGSEADDRNMTVPQYAETYPQR